MRQDLKYNIIIVVVDVVLTGGASVGVGCVGTAVSSVSTTNYYQVLYTRSVRRF
jgi:hypothetical protein